VRRNTLNYDGYLRVLKRHEETQRIADRLMEVVEDAAGPLLEIPEHRRMSVLRTIQELAQKLNAVNDDLGVVSPI